MDGEKANISGSCFTVLSNTHGRGHQEPRWHNRTVRRLLLMPSPCNRLSSLPLQKSLGNVLLQRFPALFTPKSLAPVEKASGTTILPLQTSGMQVECVVCAEIRWCYATCLSLKTLHALPPQSAERDRLAFMWGVFSAMFVLGVSRVCFRFDKRFIHANLEMDALLVIHVYCPEPHHVRFEPKGACRCLFRAVGPHSRP